jgi:tetratricopeptide (TPR) repeat protein
MQMTKQNKIIISAVAVVVLLGVYILMDRRSKVDEGAPQVTDGTISTTTSVGDIKVTASNPNYTIKQVQLNEGKTLPQPVPDLSRPVTFGNVSLMAEEKTAVTAKITQLQTELKKDANNPSAWLDLGVYQKMTGDYQGALISWEYAGKLIPENYIPWANIGDLYAYYLHDNAKAESYFKKAIANGPTQSSLYVRLAEMYRDVLSDTAKAKAIVEQGLVKIPNDPNLLQLQASLK